MKRTLTLLDEALLIEKQEHLSRLEHATRDAKNTLEILRVLLPNYDPLPAQRRFHASAAYEKGIKGGYQSGKTTAFCAEAVALAYINRPHPVLLVSPSADLAEDIVGEKLKQLCDENGLRHEYLSSKGLFEIILSHKIDKNCRLFLIGSDKPKFIKGYTVAAAGMDEPFVQSQEAHDITMARISKKSPRNCFFWSGTPEPQTMEWGSEYFERDENSGKLFTVTLPTKENKHLPPAYLKSLQETYDTRTQEVYLDGKYILLTQHPVYHAFDRKKNVANLGLKGIVMDELILGIDFNVDPMSAVLIGMKSGAFYQLKEWSLSSSNTKELCAAVIAYLQSSRSVRLKIMNTLGRSLIITGDATGRKRGTRGYLSDYEIIRDEFTAAGISFHFNVPPENPAVRDRVNCVNKLFESERFIIDEGCQKSAKDRELVSWKQSGEGFMIDKSKKDLTHLSDAADYAVYNNQMLLDGTEGEATVYVNRRHAR